MPATGTTGAGHHTSGRGSLRGYLMLIWALAALRQIVRKPTTPEVLPLRAGDGNQVHGDERLIIDPSGRA